MTFNFNTPTQYDADAKAKFHKAAKKQLRLLGDALGLDRCNYDLRSNMGGIAVSGEVTLHHDNIYIQVSQPCWNTDTGVLFRTCKGRKDYVGGRNNCCSLGMLNDIPQLAAFIMHRL